MDFIASFDDVHSMRMRDYKASTKELQAITKAWRDDIVLQKRINFLIRQILGQEKKTKQILGRIMVRLGVLCEARGGEKIESILEQSKVALSDEIIQEIRDARAYQVSAAPFFSEANHMRALSVVVPLQEQVCTVDAGAMRCMLKQIEAEYDNIGVSNWHMVSELIDLSAALNKQQSLFVATHRSELHSDFLESYHDLKAKAENANEQNLMLAIETAIDQQRILSEHLQEARGFACRNKSQSKLI